MPGDASRKNGLKGGRPKAPHTLMAEKMRKRLVEYVEKNLTPMLDAQGGAAKGLRVMMVRDWERGKDGELHRTGKWVQVTDPKEVEDLVNGSESGDEYYEIWTKNPDVNAGKNLLDQAIGKAKETVDMDVKSGGLSLAELFNKAKSHGGK